MKIIHLSQKFFPAVGGVEKYVLNLSLNLTQMGYKVVVYTSNVNQKKEKKFMGIQVKRFPILGPKKFYSFMPSLLFKLMNESADIIHAHDYRAFPTDAGATIRKIKGIPYVLTPFFHPYGTSELGFRDFLRKIYDPTLGKFKLKTADRIIALTNYEAKTLTSLGADPTSISVIPLGINSKRFYSLPSGDTFRRKWKIDDQMILYVGRIVKHKGIQHLIEAMPKIIEHFPKIKLIIVGPPTSFQNFLVQNCHRLGVNNNVIFVPGLPSESMELIEAYSACDVFVLPSLYESFGLSIVEAMACGKPVVVSNVGGCRDIVDNEKNGFLIGYGNVRQLANRIINLLNDPKLAKKFGKDGRKKVLNKYNQKRIIKRTLKIYERTTAF